VFEYEVCDGFERERLFLSLLGIIRRAGPLKIVAAQAELLPVLDVIDADNGIHAERNGPLIGGIAIGERRVIVQLMIPASRAVTGLTAHAFIDGGGIFAAAGGMAAETFLISGRIGNAVLGGYLLRRLTLERPVSAGMRRYRPLAELIADAVIGVTAIALVHADKREAAAVETLAQRDQKSGNEYRDSSGNDGYATNLHGLMIGTNGERVNCFSA